jgi:aspartate/methionine/tyrosine aminotransferase
MTIRDGRDLLDGIDPQTLTEWQWLALSATFNLSDAHARDSLTPDEHAVISRASDLFEEASETRQSELEVGLAEAMFGAAFEPVDLLESEVSVLLHYSASVSIELALKAVAASGRTRIAIIDPCFDSIPQLAQRLGLQVSPVHEADLLDAARATEGVEALFVVMPNNPTGWLPERVEFANLAEECARRDVQLIVDCSFRFFDPRLDTWSLYEVLETYPSLDYCVIEDTGKTWPLRDLKLGLTVAQEGGRIAQNLREVTDELLLNVSPFLLVLLRDVVSLSSDRGSLTPLAVRRQLVAENRRELEEAASDWDFECVRNSQIGAAWLRSSGGEDTTHLAAILSDNGVSVLPGGPFMWSDRAAGADWLRLALTRDRNYFSSAVYKLGAVLKVVRDG